MVTRRKFLWGGLGAVGVVGLGVLGFGRFGLEAEIASLVRRRLSFLKLDEAGVKAFAHDQAGALLNKKFPTWNRWRYHFLTLVAPAFKRYDRSTDTRGRAARLADGFSQQYLLSSDFFVSGADPSRLVRYVVFFDPERACSNPFARPAVDAAAPSSAA